MNLLAWTVLLFALPQASPSKAAQDHWTDGELTDKFKDLDQKMEFFREFDKRDRLSVRRLGEMDDDVRRLRAKVDLLEIQLKGLEETINALRKELATTTARLEGVGRTPATPQPGTPATGPVASSSLAVIRSQEAIIDGNSIVIKGTVANTSDRPLLSVVVEATFVDERNNVVKNESAYTEPRLIAPGATASFRILTRRDPRIFTHRLITRVE